MTHEEATAKAHTVLDLLDTEAGALTYRRLVALIQSCALEWTDKPPTKEGTYIYRVPGRNASQADLVCTVASNKEAALIEPLRGMSVRYPVHSQEFEAIAKGFWWYGPLPACEGTET